MKFVAWLFQWKSREIAEAKINYKLNGTFDTNHNRKQEDYNPLWSPWLRRRKKEWMISPPVLYTVNLYSPSLFYNAHKKLEKPSSKVAKKYSNFCFDFLPWAAQMAQTEELRSKKWLMHKLYTKLGSHREISLHQLP